MDKDLDIFEDRLGKDKIGFSFIMPGVMIGSTNVRVDFSEGKWVLTHEDSVNLVTVQHEDHVAAVLKLVALRCGFNADIRPVGEN